MEHLTAKQQQDVVVGRMVGDLERRVAEWKHSVASEREQLQRERRALEAEQQQQLERTRVLNETAEDMTKALQDLAQMRSELELRLSVTPMDLNAHELQQQWKLIDEEKLRVKKSQDLVESALERLQDVEAAIQLVN